MNIEKIIFQLSSMKDNALSFTTNDGDDEIWRADIKACEETITILSAMQDAGIDNTEQAHTMIAEYALLRKDGDAKCQP